MNARVLRISTPAFSLPQAGCGKWSPVKLLPRCQAEDGGAICCVLTRSCLSASSKSDLPRTPTLQLQLRPPLPFLPLEVASASNSSEAMGACGTAQCSTTWLSVYLSSGPPTTILRSYNRSTKDFPVLLWKIMRITF